MSEWLRSIFAIWVLTAVNYFANGGLPEGYEVLDEQLAFDGESFEIVVKRSTVADDIFVEFFLRRQGDPDSKYLYTDSSVLYARSGEKLFSFESDDPKHFGYRLDTSYPSTDRFSPGIIVGPVYDQGEGVGDTITFQWNAESEEFERQVYGIP